MYLDLGVINTAMKMLIEQPRFDHVASVPWPCSDQHQLDWVYGVDIIEHWLLDHVGQRLSRWAWTDSGNTYHIGVSFLWDRDRLLFIITWA